MKKRLQLLPLLCLVFLTPKSNAVQKRGVVEEVGNIFEEFTHGFDQIQKAARHEVSRLKPWAETLEREMKPALSRVEERLGSTLDNLGFSFGRDRVDSHAVDTTGNLLWMITWIHSKLILF